METFETRGCFLTGGGGETQSSLTTRVPVAMEVSGLPKSPTRILRASFCTSTLSYSAVTERLWGLLRTVSQGHALRIKAKFFLTFFLNAMVLGSPAFQNLSAYQLISLSNLSTGLVRQSPIPTPPSYLNLTRYVHIMFRSMFFFNQDLGI